LVAVGVLDLLPQCVSAVYFMYAPPFLALAKGFDLFSNPLIP
jgi:arginyl-tRNA--protein-N-Asp/Glu arginylyltransferase